MAKVRFLNVGLTVDVEPGSTILDAAKKIGAPEGDRCGGVCACSTCHVYVEAGLDALSEAEDEELDILEKAFDPRHNSRLGCQARIEKDVAVDVIIAEESFEAFLDENPDHKEEALELWKRGNVLG